MGEGWHAPLKSFIVISNHIPRVLRSEREKNTLFGHFHPLQYHETLTLNYTVDGHRTFTLHVYAS